MQETFESYLIEAVKKQPSLYDRSAVGYNNKEDIESAWIEVTKDVRKNIDNVNVNHCKLRWRTLRDRFVKQIGRTLDGVEHFKPEARRWEYTNQLSFLTQHLKKRKYEEPFASNTPRSKPNTNKRRSKAFNFSFVETQSMDITPDSSRSHFFSENEFHDSDIEPIIEMPDASASPKQAQFENSGFVFESEGDETFPESEDNDTKSKLNGSEDVLNKLLITTNELLQLQLKQNIEKSPNEAYFKVLDRYLMKLPPNEMDRVKVEILNLILVKQSSLRKRYKTN